MSESNKPRVTSIGIAMLIVSCVTVLSSCKSAPETQVADKPADQELGRAGAPIRFFDLNLYLTITDSLAEATNATDGISPLSSGGRLNFALPDSGMVRVSFRDASGRSLRVYPDSVYPVPGSHPITISANDTLADSLVSGVYTCRIVSDDSTFERQFAVPDQP
jgi:hypothetical protein